MYATRRARGWELRRAPGLKGGARVMFADFFFFNETATTEIYTSIDTLSLHDALPIFCVPAAAGASNDQSPELPATATQFRSEEHTSELQSPIDISYAVFCLKKKK